MSRLPRRSALLAVQAVAVAVVAALAVTTAAPASARPEPSVPSATVQVPTTDATSPSTSSNTTAAPAQKPTSYPRKVASPRRLEIRTLGIDTKVYQVGLDKRRNVVIPEDINKVGWYRFGVPPGVDRGSAVIVGHRDGSGGRKGAFYNLGTMRPGQIVTIRTSSKKDLRYRVVSNQSILKKRLPYEKYFTVTGKPRLVLISCGGYYDRNNGGYQDNIIVVAEPLFTPIKVAPARG